MIGLLSNENLQRGINWTTLSDALYAEIEAIAPSTRIAPPPPSLKAAGGYLRSIGKARASNALFCMNGRIRPELPLQVISSAAGRVLRCVFYVDPWKHTLERMKRYDRWLGHDIVFVPYREAYDLLCASGNSERYHYLPFAADTKVFRKREIARDVDIYWMGRRNEALHQAIAQYCDAKGLTYLHRDNTGFIDDPDDLGVLASRSRYFVVTPPDPSRSGGFSPLLMRYLEGLSAGCRLLGVLPASGEFEAFLPRQSLLEVAADGSDFAQCFEADQSNTEGWAATEQAAQMVRDEHGWDSRAKTIVGKINSVLEASKL